MIPGPVGGGKGISTCGLIVSRNTKNCSWKWLVSGWAEKFESFYPKYGPLAKLLFRVNFYFEIVFILKMLTYNISSLTEEYPFFFSK
jgi:hypothetical protein